MGYYGRIGIFETLDVTDEIKELIHKYIEKNGKRPLGFNYDEWNSFAEYKEYLEKELEK